MNNLSATDIVLIITALGLVITNTITAWKTSTKIDASNVKLAEIHQATDGNLSKLQEKMDIVVIKATQSEARANSLQDIVTALTTGKAAVTQEVPPPATLKHDKG